MEHIRRGLLADIIGKSFLYSAKIRCHKQELLLYSKGLKHFRQRIYPERQKLFSQKLYQERQKQWKIFFFIKWTAPACLLLNSQIR